ncbi:hypothetical protein Ciccas_012209, partial [Cichlidogyrus casuarinus]
QNNELTEAVNLINSVIGTHLGIEDEEMARSIFDSCKTCKNPVDVADQVDDTLGSFQFPETSKREIWGIISDFQRGALLKPVIPIPKRLSKINHGNTIPVMFDEQL